MPIQVKRSGNPDIDGVLWGYKWNRTTLTVSFPQSPQEYGGYAAIQDFKPFNQQQLQQIFLAVSNLSVFIPINFQLDTSFGGGNLRFAQASKIDYGDGEGLHVPGHVGSGEGNPPDPTFPNYPQGDTW